MQGEQALDYDTVAFALLNAFSKGDMEDEKDNSLGIFLTKLYKNNTNAKSKRMNSIRLSRFNAFLYRVNTPYPADELANQIIHASLLAMLSNDRNFEEEEDEEIIMSIARWACLVMENTVQKGFFQIAMNSLKYLLKDGAFGQTTLPTADNFEEMVRECGYLSSIELSAEDEKSAFHQPLNYYLTTFFALNEYILQSINLTAFYGELFKGTDKRKEVLEMFNSHLKGVSSRQSRTELFIQIFLTDAKLIGEHLFLIMKTLEEHCLGIEGVTAALQRLLDLGVGLAEVFKLQLKGTTTEGLFIEMLREKYCGNKIVEVVDQFLGTAVCNMIPLCLIANAEEKIPLDYLGLMFKGGELTQRQAVVIGFVVIQHNFEKVISKIVELWESRESELDMLRGTLMVRVIYLTFCEYEKSSMLAKIGSGINLDNLNGPALSGTIPLGAIKPDRLFEEFKLALTRILSEIKISEECLPLKIELLGLCGENVEMTRRIKALQKLFQLPVEQILKSMAHDQVNKDPLLFAAALMGLNNRMQVTFIEEPDEKALIFLAEYYAEGDVKFGRRLGELINQKSNSPLSYYLWCLSRYNLHTGSSLGGFSESMDALLSGDRKYNRLLETDFSGYFYREQYVSNLLSELWTEKKILMQIRRMLKKLLRKDKPSNDVLKEVHGLLVNEWGNVLAVKVVYAYFQAVINNPVVLQQVLGRLVPEFGFFERVFTVFQNQSEDFIDLLTFLPNLLTKIYPETLDFMARLLESQAGAKKEKEKKKSKKKKSHEKNQTSIGYEDANPILDSAGLFQYFRKAKAFGCLFGDPSNLQVFDQLFKIIVKLPNEDQNGLKNLVEEWLEMVCIFHPLKGGEIKWRVRVLSYCRIWRVIFFDLNLQLKIETLSRHFNILAELLNMHYESKADCPDLQEQLLLTLLLILQGGQAGMPVERERVPIQCIKNCLLGYRLPSPYQQHFFNCNTCSLSVCQVCAPFLHKHHDLTYMGKDGNCVHDSSQKRAATSAPQRSNIFSGPPRQRREEDVFNLNFDLGEEDMEYGEHIRFRQLMEYRLHEQQREREKQAIMKQRQDRQERRERSRSRERQNIFRAREDLIEEQRQLVGAQQNGEQQIVAEIQSEKSKSICNITKGFRSNFMFEPEFSPSEEDQAPYLSQIDARPLRNILMHELQMAVGSDEQGKVKAEPLKERYNLFKQSAYFKTPRGGEYSGLRGLSAGLSMRRSLLTANKKFMAFPSASNGILLLSVTVLGLKMLRRLANKAMNDYEQQRAYISNAINNSNLSFEPFQLSFGKGGLLAVVGVTQLGFFMLSPDGKVQKFFQSDIKCSEPISKFQWIGRQRSNVFAISYGSCIRIGSVSEDMRVRTGNRLKIQIDKIIKDFQIVLENHSMTVYVLDVDGDIYSGEFDFRDSRAINIADHRVDSDHFSHLQSMFLFEKKMLVSSQSGKLHLLKLEGKSGVPVFLQTYDFQQILKGCEGKLKGQYFIHTTKLIHSNDYVTSMVCLLTKASSEGKRKGFALCVLRISGSGNDLDVLVLADEEIVEHCEVLELGENNFLIVAIEESGTVWVTNYSVSSELLQQREESKVPMTEQSILAVNKVINTQKLLALARCCEPKRCNTYKDGKEITSAYNIFVDSLSKIVMRAAAPHKYFITGITLTLQASGQGELGVWVFGQQRRIVFEKNREIQIGLTLKQTLQCFVEDEQIVLPFKGVGCNILNKGIKIYGVEQVQESVYRNAYAQLHQLVTIHFLYDETNLIHYLENPEKGGLPKVNLSELQKLKSNYKYTHKQLVLLMKMELLRVSTSKGLKEQQLQEMLQFVRADLLPQSEKRQFLQKSCWRLMKQLCYLILGEGEGRVGHPFEFRTVLDLYYFQRLYGLWNGAKQLASFQKLVTFLYGLIFKRISNLYLILQLSPTLIYELTFFYKNALHSLKQSGDPSEQIELGKLISICPSYVALVCEYYQTLKNAVRSEMVDQKQSCPQKVVLDLLEEVFCATKKQLYREIFVSPELYLDRLFLSKRKSLPLATGVNLFNVRQEGQPDNHASRKASIGQPEVVESEESQNEMYQESEKQMLEEQVREMPEIVQPVVRAVQLKPELQREMPQGLKKVTKLLCGYLLGKQRKVNFIYYQFSFEMLTALFKLEGYLTKQNAVFYLGFAFNLLRIVEFNCEQARDKEYLDDFFRSVIEAIPKQSHSLLFLVLNYFFEPEYGPKGVKGVRTLNGAKTKLSEYFVNYLMERNVDVQELLTVLRVTKISRPVTMAKAMKFFAFELENQAYQLRFLGNLLVLLKSKQHPQVRTPSKRLKQFVLGIVVRYKVRVFSNIMIAENWVDELQQAKIEVGFEAFRDNPEEGIRILYDCASKRREIFVRKLSLNNDYIARLQSLLDQKGVKSNPVLQMLTIYYESD